MLKYKRPSKPKDFDIYVNSSKTNVENAIKNKQKPNFVDDWSKFKKVFSTAQNAKCGYCESFVNTDDGDMEHYAPKSEISDFKSDDPKTWGKEIDYLNNVSGRELDVVCNLGYWWGAYSWDNYLFACKVCNSKWKRTLFPIKEKRKRNPKKNDKETPLLLNPFEDIKPEEHFEYNSFGAIKPKSTIKNNKTVLSEYGFETIRTCGLDRNTLLISRKEKAEIVYLNLKRISKTSDKERIKEYYENIYNAGNENTAYAGMVRIIFFQELGLTWLQLEQMIKNI